MLTLISSEFEKKHSYRALPLPGMYSLHACPGYNGTEVWPNVLHTDINQDIIIRSQFKSAVSMIA